MPTIELFGNTDEVPQGHEDFAFDGAEPYFAYDFHGLFRWGSIPDIFSGKVVNSAYWQRRVVEAAIAHYFRQSEKIWANDGSVEDYRDTIINTNNWRRIGDKAAEGAGNG